MNTDFLHSLDPTRHKVGWEIGLLLCLILLSQSTSYSFDRFTHILIADTHIICSPIPLLVVWWHEASTAASAQQNQLPKDKNKAYIEHTHNTQTYKLSSLCEYSYNVTYIAHVQYSYTVPGMSIREYTASGVLPVVYAMPKTYCDAVGPVNRKHLQSN